VPRIEELAGPRLLAGVAGEIAVTIYSDGTPGTVTSPVVSVVDAAGETVPMGTVAVTSGRITAQLPAASNDRPKVLTATWTFTMNTASHEVTTVHETAGGLLFSEAEARAYENGAMPSSAYPADTLLRARDQVHDAFEDIIGVGLGVRSVREVVDGPGSVELELRRMPIRRVVSVRERTFGTQAWTAYNNAAIADILVLPDGAIRRESLGSFTRGRQNIAVEYEHGLYPIPLDLRQAGLRVTRNVLVRSNANDRLMSATTQVGTERFAVAGLRDGAWFGIPPVDSVLQFYRDRYRVPTVR
jgi:hypothetical protein